MTERRNKAQLVELHVNRCAGLGTSKPHSSEFLVYDQWHAEVGERGMTAVDALRSALATLPPGKAVSIFGVPELTAGHAGEFLGRLPATGAVDTGRGTGMKQWLAGAA